MITRMMDWAAARCCRHEVNSWRYAWSVTFWTAAFCTLAIVAVEAALIVTFLLLGWRP